MSNIYDVFVIGGGINGCGIARDAAGRGYSVGLAEMGDLASGTSSNTSKLIHGGFRYLEHYEFRLVRESLSEREVLLKMAPHIIWPMRFVLPHHKAMRPAWLLCLGLFLYDHIGARKLLPKTKVLDLKTAQEGRPLKPIFKKGFEYSDCWADDARLVVLVAADARNRGATIMPRHKVIAAKRENGVWHIETQEANTGVVHHHQALVLVNAAGPWIDGVLGQAFGIRDSHNVRLVQGSHIVVPKLFEHDRAYLFQNADKRIVFALPFAQDFTMIGTTDYDYDGDPTDAKITPTETAYLCAAASSYFNKPVLERDIVRTFSGVRPLYNDGASSAQEATRDYVLRREGGENEAPLLNIFGGKLTTHRKLAEAMMTLIAAEIGEKGRAWTANSSLPGGDFTVAGFDALVQDILIKHPFLSFALAHRLVRAYGTKSWDLLKNCQSMADLGQDFGAGLTASEVHFLMVNEWAQSAEDVLWRRTKLGLHYTDDMVAELEKFMRNNNEAVLSTKA